MHRSPSFSSSFNSFLLSTYCPLSSKLCTSFQSSEKKFIDPETSSQGCFIYFLHFLPNFSNLWSASTSSTSLPLTHSFLTCRLASINILSLKVCSQGRWRPSHHLIVLGFSPSLHSPLPSNNLDHQSPRPMFLLGNIFYVYSFLPIFNVRTLERPFSSTYLWALLSLILLVLGHHVNLYKTWISHHFLIQ